MIAAFPMYARPETRAAWDALWTLVRDGLRARGVDAPDALDPEIGAEESWAREDLVLGQICSLPWRARYRDRLRLVGACDFGLDGAGPGEYYSVFVVRDDAAAQAPGPDLRFAYSDPMSQSGWAAPQAWAARRGFHLPPHLETGSHAESLRAVAAGRADLAALDAVSWQMFRRWEPAAQAVRVVGRTETSPGISFCTRSDDPEPHREALTQALGALPAGDRAVLGLRAVVALPGNAYDLPLPPTPEALRV